MQQNSNKYSLKGLEEYVKNWKIFIDTCSILHDSSDDFWNNVIPLLEKHKKSIIVPYRSLEEVHKHSNNKEKPELAKKATESLEQLNKLISAGYIEVRGEKTDNFADNVFQVVFIKFRMTHRLLLITQDVALAKDIQALNNITSVRANKVNVKKINHRGLLSNFLNNVDEKAESEKGNNAGNSHNHSKNGDNNNNKNNSNSNNNNKNGSNKKNNNSNSKNNTNSNRKNNSNKSHNHNHNEHCNHRNCNHSADGSKKETGSEIIHKNEIEANEDIFEICKKVTSIEDSQMPVRVVPSENSTVYTPEASIKLLKKVAEGGEGAIYTTNTPYVAKIYKKENNTRRKYEKIKLMLSKDIECEGVCYPVEILYNEHKEFVGYLMPRAEGKELQKSIFIKPLFLKNFPNWKKRDTVELCITILEKIEYLHAKNIIMGDINPANILVVSPKEVYFVDTDSYQIEDFPCPVGTINYTAPEIQRKHFADFLRTMGNENFAVATLLFMIMLPGKPPYSQQGGEDPIENIIKMDFSYPFGDNSNRKTPDGPWRYIWSHLTFDLKKAFYNTFRGDGENSSEQTRLSVSEWISIFTYYLKLLDSGKFGEQDEMSEELFPTRHKKHSNVDYINCRLCGQEVGENQSQNGICRNCLNTGEVCTCNKCGKEFLYTNYERYIKNVKRFKTCPDCFEEGKKIAMVQRCVSCGCEFELTNSQYDYYVDRGLNIPRRCEDCRGRSRVRTRPVPRPKGKGLFRSILDLFKKA